MSFGKTSGPDGRWNSKHPTFAVKIFKLSNVGQFLIVAKVYASSKSECSEVAKAYAKRMGWQFDEKVYQGMTLFSH